MLTSDVMTTTKTYDNLNRLLSISTASTAAPEVPFSAHTYEHNNANQRTKATLADGSYWVYSYDDLGQVTGVRAGAGPAGEDVISQQTGKRFVPADPEPFTHDADGNLLTDGRWTYTWNAENRLIQAQSTDTKLVFTYDHIGRRVRKQLYNWQTDTWQLTADTRYIYDGWNLIAELTLNSELGTAELTKSYLWGLDLSSTLQGAGGVGGLLAITTNQEPGTQNTVLPAYYWGRT